MGTGLSVLILSVGIICWFYRLALSVGEWGVVMWESGEFIVVHPQLPIRWWVSRCSYSASYPLVVVSLFTFSFLSIGPWQLVLVIGVK